MPTCIWDTCSSDVEIFKYFLLYLLYVDNYFHRIKIYLQRKHCLLFHASYLLTCLKTSFSVKACLRCAILLESYWFSLKSYHRLSIAVNYCALSEFRTEVMNSDVDWWGQCMCSVEGRIEILMGRNSGLTKKVCLTPSIFC